MLFIVSFLCCNAVFLRNDSGSPGFAPDTIWETLGQIAVRHLVQTVVLVAPIVASSGTTDPFPVGEGVAAELQLKYSFVMRCLEKLDLR
jgi:hypothetical protein